MSGNGKSGMSVRQWLPLIGLTLSAFVFNTSEFMPIGLLTDIAAGLHVTEARAGMLISVYAWMVALLSLPLMLLFARMEYRRLLLCTLALFVASHLLSAVAGSYGVLMVSRIGVACSHAVFWSIASPLAVRIVPEKRRSLALSMIVTGTSVAMVAGMPLGRVIGLYVGWRTSFLCVAVLAAVILCYLLAVFPKVPGGKSFSVHQLPALLRNRVLVGIYLMALLVPTAHYTVYSYIEPFLEQVAGLRADWITLTLTAFGAAGIFGSILFARYYDRQPSRFIGAVVVCIALLLLLLRLAAFDRYTVMALCVVWGVAVTAFNVAFQAETIRTVPEPAAPVAMSIFSGIYNVGIGCGALFGGAVCTWRSVADIGYAGGALAVAAVAFCMFGLLPRLKRRMA